MVGLATVHEEDYKSELTVSEDPTLSSTHLNESSRIAAGLVQWGGDYVPIFSQMRDPLNRSRYSASNAPLATYHGNDDGVIGLAHENSTKEAYEANGVSYEQHVLVGYAHDANDALILVNGTNISQHESMFAFVTKVQHLRVVDRVEA